MKEEDRSNLRKEIKKKKRKTAGKSVFALIAQLINL